MPSADLQIDAVLFDYGLVLSAPPYQPAWDRMRAILHASEGNFHTAYWRPRHAYDQGVLSGERYWQAVANELGRALDASMLAGLLAADIDLWTQPNEAMIGWAMALQQAGVRTGILSNLGDAMEAGLRQRFTWLNGFDHLTFSHRLGMAKPDPAIYRHAWEGLGVAPERILFLDDREDNIEAARALGLQTLRYTGHAAFEQTMEAVGLGHLLRLPAARPAQ